MTSLDKGQSWQEFHEALAQIGIEVRLQGNGCIIKDPHSKTAIKTSRLDRNFTKSKLEAKLGSFQLPFETKVEEKERYVARPLHKHRGELYAEYRAAIAGRKKAYENLREEQDRRRLIALAAGRKTEVLETLKKEMSGKRAELRAQTPFNRWNDFLKWKAEDGDEVALQILRSKKEPIRPSSLPETFTPDARVSELKLKQSRIRSDSSLAWKDKRRLLSISKMLQMQAQEATSNKRGNAKQSLMDGMTWRVDSSGNVLYPLKSGGMIKDNGDKIFFSLNDPGAAQVAQGFARMMFGRKVKVAGNGISRRQNKIAR